MFDAADWFEQNSYTCDAPDIERMLRQAANDEGELEKERKKVVDLCKDCAAYAKENSELRKTISDIKATCEEKTTPCDGQHDPDSVSSEGAVHERLFAYRILDLLKPARKGSR